MTFPTTEYKGHELRAYLQQTFPLYRDPYATGPRRYSAVIRIDTIPADEGSARRYTMQFKGEITRPVSLMP